MPSFYVPLLSKDAKYIPIEGEEFHHAVTVMRNRVGDIVLLTNGKGLIAEACIEAVDKKRMAAKILSINEIDAGSPLIATAFSLLKNKNDLLIVEKLTELGVREFFPFVATRTVRMPGEKVRDKFMKTAIAAVKQCDNPFLPDIYEPEKLPKLIAKLKENDYSLLVALEKNVSEMITLPAGNPGKICLFIGPEGGFDDNEIAILEAENCFSLGKNILRAETAAIAAAAQLMLLIQNSLQK